MNQENELAALLKRWGWDERSIAIALGIRRGHQPIAEVDYLSGGLSPEVIQAIDIARYEGWSITKIAEATAISERQISDWLLSRKSAQQKITAITAGDEEKLMGALATLGLRPAELTTLRVGDIDFKTNTIQLKNRKIVF